MFAVRGLTKHFRTDYGHVPAVNGISFSAEEGEFYTLLGASGCGKTTTLQCIAGLETPDEGEIDLAGTIVFSSRRRINQPTHMRQIGLVFQSYAIWPHMSVLENVTYPLLHGRLKMSARQARDRAMNALTLVQLETLAERPAPFLSGGQQQRVAVARALVAEPRVLLLDEPLSNLDAKLREGMRLELRALVKRLNITTLYVTHDQVEALSMSDRVAVMANGQILQEGTPRDIYLAPCHELVANFVGKINFMQATVQHDRVSGSTKLITDLGELECGQPFALADGTAVLAAFRPEAALLLNSNSHHPLMACPNVVSGTIDSVAFYGDAVECHVRVGKQVVSAKTDPYADFHAGDAVRLAIPPERIMIISDGNVQSLDEPVGVVQAPKPPVGSIEVPSGERT
jgi:iron(III) transport system ATP-binding protein